MVSLVRSRININLSSHLATQALEVKVSCGYKHIQIKCYWSVLKRVKALLAIDESDTNPHCPWERLPNPKRQLVISCSLFVILCRPSSWPNIEPAFRHCARDTYIEEEGNKERDDHMEGECIVQEEVELHVQKGYTSIFDSILITLIDDRFVTQMWLLHTTNVVCIYTLALDQGFSILLFN